MRFAWKIIKSVLLTYAIVFSLLGTLSIIVVAHLVLRPIREVRALADSNPTDTHYMRKVASEGADSLLHAFIPLDSISPNLIKAVLAAEDDGFYSHPGFDLNAIAGAIETNKTRNGIQHGASTITQQMAKNLFTNSERSFRRKVRELGYAVLMEHYLGKDRILELYLNYAQWGENIFGCEAAAQYYYRKPCSKLSLNESVRLAAVLAKPEKLNPHFTKSKLLRKRLAVIANNLWLHKTVNDSTRDAVNEIGSEQDTSINEGEAVPQEDIETAEQILGSD